MQHKLPVRALRRTGAVAAVVATAVAVSTVLAPGSAFATPGCADVPDAVHSVPAPAGPPALTSFTDPIAGPVVTVSLLGADQKAYFYDAQFGTDTVLVSDLTCLGGVGSGQPAQVVGNQKVQYFVIGGDKGVWFKTANSDGTWSAWTRVPGSSALDGVQAVVSGNRTDIFYLGSGKNIVHQTQVDSTWSAPESLGGASNFGPSVTRGADGKFHVWVTGTNGRIYFNSGITGSWSGWHQVNTGATASAPAAAVGYGAASREDVFVVGTSGGLYQGTFTNLGSFTGWHKILPNVNVGASTRIAAAAQGTGHMVVFGSTGQVSFVTQYPSSVPGQWEEPFLGPYTCDPDCLPETASTTLSPQAKTQTAQGGPRLVGGLHTR